MFFLKPKAPTGTSHTPTPAADTTRYTRDQSNNAGTSSLKGSREDMDRQEMMKRIMEKRRKARPEMPEDDSHDRDYSLDDDFLSEDMEPDMDVMSEDREEHEKLSHRDRVAKIMRDRRGY